MLKIIRFFQNIIYSFSSPQFYQNLLRAPFSFTLKYFSFLIFLISAAYTIYFSIVGFPIINKFLDHAPNLVKNLIPVDYALNVKSGEATFVGIEPFIIPTGELYRSFNFDTKEKLTPANFLTVDTKTPFSENEYRRFDTIFWLTKTSLILPDSNNPKSAITIMSLKDFGDLVINQKIILAGLSRSLPVLKSIVQAVFISFLPISFFFYLVFKLLGALTTGMIFVGLSKLAKMHVSLSKSWQLAIHASTLPFLIEIAANWTNIKIGIPFWYTLLNLIIIFFFLKNTEIKEVKI